MERCDGEVGGEHRQGRDAQKRQNVAAGLHVGNAQFATYESVPNERPTQVDEGVDAEHRENAEGRRNHEREQLCDHERRQSPHVGARTAAAQQELRVEGGDGEERAAHAEDGEHGGAFEPFLPDGQHDEFARNGGDAQHHGKGEKGGEAEHLAKHPHLLLRVVAALDKKRLRHTVHHARDDGMPHVVPLVGLVVVAHHDGGVKAAEHDGKEIVVEVGDDVGGQ